MNIGHLILNKQTKNTKHRTECHSLGVSSEAYTVPTAQQADPCMKYHDPH